MDWKDLGKKLAALGLPVLGTLVAGPAGGQIGALVAAAIGSGGSPDEVDAALVTDPTLKVRLVELQKQHEAKLLELHLAAVRVELEADTARLDAVNQTMRAEAQSDDLWQKRWRPFWGFTSAVAFFAQVGAIAYLMVSGSPQAGDMINALGSLAMFWSVPMAILGISAWHRGVEKVERIKARK
jgi:hypothetical protein